MPRAVLGWSVLVSLIVLSCGGEQQKPLCPTPEVRSCVGPSNCEGTTTCERASGIWNACVCAGPPDGGGDGGTVHLGAGCAADVECPTGAFCLRSDSMLLFGGAPPSGTCVGTCDPQTACARFGVAAVCVETNDPMSASSSAGGLCFESCAIGAGGGTGAAKCHGRERVACAPVEGAATNAGYCRPLCSTSGECLTGVCDPARGVCVSNAAVDRAFGLVCAATPDGGAPDGAVDGGRDANDDGAVGGPDSDDASGTEMHRGCGGLCVGLSASSDVCTRRCRFGSTGECAPETSAGRRRGGCLFVTKGGGLGDLGYCGELCDCNADCSETSFVCDAFDDATLDRAFGRKGVCTPPSLVVNRPLPCSI